MRKLILLAAVAMIGALLALPGTASAATCTTTGFFRDNINMTAALINPGTVSGEVNATGCNIGVYFDNGTGSVNNANIHGANYFGVLVNGDVNSVSVDVTDSSIHDIGESPLNGSQHGVAVYYRALGLGSATANISGNAIWNYQKGGIVVNGANATANVIDNTVAGQGPVNWIAQNGIQLGWGATGVIEGNTVSGNYYTGSYWKSGGVLFYQPLAGTVLHPGRNNLFDNQINFLNFGRLSPVK